MILVQFLFEYTMNIGIINVCSFEVFKIILCQNFSKSKSFDYIDSKYALKTATKYKPIY